MVQIDPFSEFKQRQREAWGSFAPLATFTTAVAARLVAFADIRAGDDVLDVATGTGVVAVTAARRGARVQGIDLTPALLEHARANARVAGVEVTFSEGDAEALPFPAASFDVVTSEFGHIFAPRPDVVVAEMRRVLRPGGRVAFATWPPEHFFGQFSALVGRYTGPLPDGIAPPPLWGVPSIVAERLAAGGFEAPFFGRGVMTIPALSLDHLREFLEFSVGRLGQLVDALAAEPDTLAQLRAEIKAAAAPYYSDNLLHQDYLLTRAHAR